MEANNSTWPYNSENAKNIVQAILAIQNNSAPSGDFQNGSSWPYDNEDAQNVVEALLKFINTIPSQTKFCFCQTSLADGIGPLAMDYGVVEWFHQTNTTGIKKHPGGIIRIEPGGGAAGIIKITWWVTPNEASAFGIWINGVLSPFSTFGSNSLNPPSSGSFVITLNEGDEIQLATNKCAAPVTFGLQGTIDGGEVMAAIYVERLIG